MKKINKVHLDRAKNCYELKELERLGLTPTLEQREMILKYISLLLKWNAAAGLISPGDEELLFLRHFCDSLQPDRKSVV
jgi:16S rRNA G527 N7-methylase RsmG